MLRVIREVQPTWVIGENVPGLVNWSEGVVFEEVQSDLEAEGYEVQSFILPAAGVGAPHRRDRVWIVAYSEGHGNNRTPKRTGEKARGQDWHKIEQFIERGEIRTASNTKSEQNNRHGSRGFFSKPTGTYEQGIVAYSDRYGRCRIENEKYSAERRQPSQCRVRQCNEDGAPSNPSGTGQQKQNISAKSAEQRYNTRGDNASGADWQVFPTQSPVCDGNDGISARLVRYILRNGGDCYTEEEAEKEAKRIISKVRAEGIKAGGNAIVHQVALQIFKSINEFEKTL
jgi:DNA (cytosine-5)-methyltransferase 1